MVYSDEYVVDSNDTKCICEKQAVLLKATIFVHYITP